MCADHSKLIDGPLMFRPRLREWCLYKVRSNFDMFSLSMSPPPKDSKLPFSMTCLALSLFPSKIHRSSRHVWRRSKSLIMSISQGQPAVENTAAAKTVTRLKSNIVNSRHRSQLCSKSKQSVCSTSQSYGKVSVCRHLKSLSLGTMCLLSVPSSNYLKLVIIYIIILIAAFFCKT